ncbi:MAG: mechanosensitive ion channel, partial [Planctomycetales bacterium]|nr:mechanosensitive ion channel [Planctomycetales bacterium]
LTEIDDALLMSRDEEARLEFMEQELQRELPASRIDALREKLVVLATAQQSVLQGLQLDYGAYLDTLVKLNVQEEAIVSTAEKFLAFIDKRILWIRSISPVGLTDIPATGISFRWIASQARWQSFLSSLVAWGREQSVQVFFTVFLFVFWFGIRWNLTKQLAQLGERAENHGCRDFTLTARALLATAFQALFLPMLITWMSAIFDRLPGADDLSRPLSAGLASSARVLLPLTLWWWIVTPKGLAECHFDWTRQSTQMVRFNIRWLLFTLPLVVCLFVVFKSTGNVLHERAAARFCFVVGSGLVAYFLFRVFSPTQGITLVQIAARNGGWIDHFKWVWFSVLCGIPLIFAGMALAGYLYTADQLMRRFYMSLALLSGTYVFGAACVRWIQLKRRMLAMEQAKERRAAAEAEAKKAAGDATAELVSGGDVGPAELAAIDLTAVNQQTRRLLSTFQLAVICFGLYFIWVGVFPALAKLDEFGLWQTTIEVQHEQSADGEVTDETMTVVQTRQYKWVTLGNLLAAVIIAAVAVVATLNVPGLLEIAILQRLPLDAALRYAVTTVTRYLIILLGTIWSLGWLGIGWSKVQWLVAAISVGLGFGLQEIFANFVSGLILLFERPLRAGDIVTIGDTTGEVVRIKTRATSIRDWDRKELIVPNKELVTGKVLNWTLSDTVNRICVTTGIAYGSPVEKARQIIEQIAVDHPFVEIDPAPTVTFEEFGDSSLNLTLRCYILIANMAKRLSVVNDLHTEIHRQLHEAGVEIPFPQRDLHIRSSSIPLRLNTAGGASETSE